LTGTHRFWLVVMMWIYWEKHRYYK
jgi:hypothetical protein